MSVREKITRTIRISDVHWHQLEIEAKKLGFSSRHAYMVDRLKIATETDKAIATA
jgi:hypothetical protein